jgi:uncharacterized glyoxalase superfamily protein PhnB
MTNAADVRYWQTLTFRDADAMMAWLGKVGFVEHATHRNGSDSTVVEHAEWLWPGGGGIMFGSVRDGSVGSAKPGAAAAYLVTDSPDDVFAAAVAAGATVVRPMQDEDYGGRDGVVQDPEGNHWSFGNYQPR